MNFSRQRYCGFCIALEEYDGRIIEQASYGRHFHDGELHHQHHHLEVTESNELCAFCAHLRPKTWASIGKFRVELGTLANIVSRQSVCKLCAFTTKIAARFEQGSSSHQVILQKAYPESEQEANSPYGRRTHNKDGRGTKPENEIYAAGWLLLVEDEYRWTSMCDFEVKRSTGTTRNFTGLIDWEDIRTKLDSIKPLEPWLSRPSGFRVIDVKHNNVVLAPPSCEYVALSYVWGVGAPDEPFQASLSNISSLENPQGLLSGRIPATVQDAMKACAGLGKRYLWVDRFCILQDGDDNPSKKYQIDAMGDIYRHAFATLVALEGDGADHGLFGVSNLKRELLHHFHIGNQVFQEVVSPLNFNKTVRESVWNSRGWTLQEAVLSNKLIFFTQYGVKCEYGPNESIKEEHLGFRSTSAKSLFWPEANSFDSLKASLRQITERKFGKEDDILNAFSGVLQDRYGDHRFGLPLQGFEEALLWSKDDPVTIPRNGTAHNIFPSWSWSSIRGLVGMEYSVSDKSFGYMSVSTWGFLDANGTDVLFPWPKDFDFTSQGDGELRCDRWIMVAVLAWQKKCLEEPPPDLLRPRPYPQTFWELKKKFIAEWPTYRSFWKDSHGIDSSSGQARNFINKFELAQIRHAILPGKVMVRTQVAELCVRAWPRSRALQIYNKSEEIGLLSFDTFERRYSLLEDHGKDPKRVEFMAISIRLGSEKRKFWNPSQEEPARVPIEALRIGNWDEVLAQESFEMMNVLAIETHEGISRRLGIGGVSLQKWAGLDRTFKAIVLE